MGTALGPLHKGLTMIVLQVRQEPLRTWVQLRTVRVTFKPLLPGEGSAGGYVVVGMAAGGHLNCVKFLLQHSPSEVVNHRQCTPPMRATMKGRTEIVRHLFDNNAIVSSQLNANKESALTLGCGSGKVDLVKLLLERGSPIVDRSAELNAALREAVLFGRVELVQILLNHGADANHSNDTSSPVIFLSIDSNKVSILDLLIAHGANIEQLGGQDYTQLMKAAKTGKREMVAALLVTGANPKVRRKVDRKTALSLSRSQGHKEICTIILKAKVKKTS
ncbi:Ankyrin repeat and KH domain-containing protein [Echinococcus granulosus]|uniref:Ankyrin repeat and KH domain-containing protein n=1 Tax=Echinococcus granulosus TaxID=6210 RepID=W6U9V7_ECHGR|nr:Ankyrin repeat and KH domain-containing protein [Echinococcus granulosus]EUB55277.1 Ankyrin repeat and KH domain-containing protein [Echinococcus granulosus]